jgi:hypothetical protein
VDTEFPGPSLEQIPKDSRIFSESFGKYIDRNILFFILKLLK